MDDQNTPNDQNENDYDEQKLKAMQEQWRALQQQGTRESSSRSLENRILFGAFINALMQQKGLSASALADTIDTSEDYIVNLLRGELPIYRLSESILTRIASALEVSPNLLTVFLKKPSPSQTRSDEDKS